MATLISPLSSTSLDIDSLITYIKQDLIDNKVITDIDYSGSNISILIQILAYMEQNINATIALNANQTNLLLSTIRQNVIYEAKKLGYNITRPISSKLQVTITANSNVTIPQFTEFTVGNYTFLNLTDIILLLGNSATVTLVEGIYIDSVIDTTLSFTPATIIKNKILPYTNIENDNLYVQVNKNSTGFIQYTKTDSKFDLDLVQNTFYIDTDPETEFANVQFSYLSATTKITTADIVNLSFILSSGSVANGQIVCSVTGYDVSIVVVSPSTGGSDIESITSIQDNSPIFYNTGNRTVNENDYISFLVKNSIVKIANAWGGEKEFPKLLGYTYLSIVPETSRYISVLEQSTLINYLAKPRIIATGKVFKNPNYLPINISIKILGTVVNLASKKIEIETNINSYFLDINNFNTFFYESKIIRMIETVFANDINSSVRVVIAPQLRLDVDLFTTGVTTDICIPNSNKKYYLTKLGVTIDLPVNYLDIETYLINGWTKTILPEENLIVSFSGTVNAKVVTVSGTVSGTIIIDTLTYNYYNILFDAIIIGKYIPDINILRLDDLTTDVATTQYIDISYSPQMNVISEKSTIFELGSIVYL